MKKIIIIVTIILICSMYFLAKFNTRIQQFELFRLNERFGLKSNSIQLLTSNLSKKDSVKMYWIGYQKSERKKDTILIYNKDLISDIPDSYGKNELLLEYMGTKFNKIGIWKKKAWYKYKYEIEVKENTQGLIVEWQIFNDYEKVFGIDTVYNQNHF